MKEIKWKYAGPSLSEKDLGALERELSLQLPEDYKAFIKDHNGARPKPNAVDLPSGRETVLERMLRIEPGSSGSMLRSAEIMNNRNEQRLVPFGEDPFGNLFCFSYAGNSVEAVVFWNHEKSSTEKICETFSELLDLIHPAKN